MNRENAILRTSISRSLLYVPEMNEPQYSAYTTVAAPGAASIEWSLTLQLLDNKFRLTHIRKCP